MTATPQSISEKFRGRNRQAFEEFYHLHAAKLFGLAKAYTGNENAAEEIFQTAFKGLFEAIHAGRDIHNPLAFLATTIRNRAVSQIRRRRWTKLPEDWSLRELQRHLKGQCGEFDSPSNLLLREEEHETLWTEISKLSAEEQEIVLLHAIQEYGFELIGGMMKLPTSTVHHRYHAAIQKLNKALGG